AALPVEAERLAEREVDLLRERLAQQAPGPEEPRAHGGLRDAEGLRRLLDAELLQGTQHEHGPVALGQRVDARLEQAAELPAQRLALGAWIVGGNVHRGMSGVGA